MRIGHGYDIHAFGSNKPLVLAGVAIPYDDGLIAHSDGDVVLHAAMDALLGAIGQGDIGNVFPDNDPRYANADSRRMLAHVMEQVIGMGYRVGNIDVTVIAQAPKLAPHIKVMQQNLAEDLHVCMGCVNIKATTHEGLDAVGRKEAIAVHAVVLIEREENVKHSCK